MTCKHFGQCASCRLHELSYPEQCDYKLHKVTTQFSDLYKGRWESFFSEESHFRARAEFRVLHWDGTPQYGMSGFDGKPVAIESCPIVVQPIHAMMPKLLGRLRDSEILHRKLFSVEFLSGASEELVVSLIYHRALDSEWEEAARELTEKLGIHLIGRSRKQKIIIGRSFVQHGVALRDQKFQFHQYENSFSQPNLFLNPKMVGWVCDKITNHAEQDLLELYCGSGNFTIPLSRQVRKVLATEVSKTAIRIAQENRELNECDNLLFVRLSAEELTQALNRERYFNRLRGIDLDSYDFRTVFVDPPRAGIDLETLRLLQRFETILYISCNPDTLYENACVLTETHEMTDTALFDQFPHTEHIECGACFKKRYQIL